MESVAPFQVTIPNYKEVSESKKNVTYYNIEVQKKGAEKWTAEKRFSEFDALDKALRKVYGNLPQLPGKSFLALKQSEELEKRRDGLEKYLQELARRTDVLSSDVFKRFLQLDNFAPEAVVTPPKHLGDLDGLVLGTRDFVYNPEQKLLFVAISDMSVTSRVDSFLTNMKLPWEKKLPQGTLVTVGAVECYLQKGDLHEEVKFEKLWTKTFQTQVICIYWEPTSCNLCIGADDGSLTILKVPAELNYIKYEEVLNFKLHAARVMGVYYDGISEYTYTVGEDKKFKVFNPRKQAIVADLSCGGTGGAFEQGVLQVSNQLTNLVADKENKRVFISNRSGRVFIYDITPVTPELLHSFQAHQKGAIRGLFFDGVKNYLITANYDDGVLALIDLQKPGKEKYAHNIANLQGKQKARFVVWSPSRSELVSGAEDGSITFWDAKKAAPVYAMQGHNGGVTKLQWIEKSQMLITAGKDKKISFYTLPDEWRDHKLEAELQKDAKIQKQTTAMLEFQKQQQKREEDSDEDDLAGWAN